MRISPDLEEKEGDIGGDLPGRRRAEDKKVKNEVKKVRTQCIYPYEQTH